MASAAERITRGDSTMTRRRGLQRVNETSPGIDRATFQPGDYGRVMHADGTAQWWGRSSNGNSPMTNGDGPTFVAHTPPPLLGTARPANDPAVGDHAVS